MAGLPNGAGGLDDQFNEWGLTNNISALQGRDEETVRAYLMGNLGMEVPAIDNVGMGNLDPDFTDFLADITADLTQFWTDIGEITSDVGEFISAVVNSVLGVFGLDWLVTDAAEALETQRLSIAALGAAVAAMESRQQGYHFSGVSAFVDFSARADASSIGADFTQTYSGSGTGYWGIKDGRVHWYPVNDSPRTCIALYNVTPSDSDYQSVGMTTASVPIRFNDTAEGRNLIVGRSNSAGTSYVFADIGKTNVKLGCVVGGSKTVWDTEGITFKPSGNYWLVCGTTGGARIFQVFEGTTPILTHTEVGTASMLGPSYRYAGLAGYTYANAFGSDWPAKIAAFAFADNQPPNFIGSGAVITRTDTDGWDVDGGSHYIGDNFFDTLSDHTDDITSDLVTGKFTVSLEGWYRVEARAKTYTTWFPNHFSLMLYVNGSPQRWMGNDQMRGLSGGASAIVPDGVAGDTLVYLIPGDYVQLGYSADTDVDDVLTGDGGGYQTYFTISLLSRSHS